VQARTHGRGYLDLLLKLLADGVMLLLLHEQMLELELLDP
jgi:hypothetical protein